LGVTVLGSEACPAEAVLVGRILIAIGRERDAKQEESQCSHDNSNPQDDSSLHRLPLQLQIYQTLEIEWLNGLEIDLDKEPVQVDKVLTISQGFVKVRLR
jgi:hypothetical protein